MSESDPHPPTPSPCQPLPPGPDPSEGAMALEPVRLFLLADAPSSRPPSPPLPIRQPGESQKTQETALPSSPKILAPETMGATRAWKMGRRRERAGQARGPLPPRTDQVRKAMAGMVMVLADVDRTPTWSRAAGTARAKEWN
ncbi:hypothetical protein E4U09_003022 [Claviceps aff. purpurea]|uniref:Uncharacterized protein n=1 Tax=Claviceps aff. purpurea TaxID=1967640 RepID=A0A9P7TY79_9HYPO|nr:hypothetical protein E4U09_003022 [Claviceps aff. purpurea]